jgi:two-component system nitrogen regulation sensor histidine kinase NtrY
MIHRLLRRYRIQVLLRLAALAATVAAGVWLLGAIAVPVAPVALVALLVVWQVWALLLYTERTPRELLRFLEAIRYDDLSLAVSARGRGPLFEAIADRFAEVTEAFRRLRSEREEQAQYLQTVVRHVGVALIAFRADGEVALLNTAAKRLLGVPRLRHIEGLGALSPRLAQMLPALQNGDRTLVRVERGDRTLDLAVHATHFRLAGEPHVLVSLQDIRRELEEKEMEAWQQLTRVLTHEIVNSVAPIASLAATANQLLHRDDTEIAGDGAPPLADAREALQTIERRSQGLIHFVESYRSLTKIPKPNFALFPVADLFGNVQTLLRTSLREKGVALDVQIVPETLELAADEELIEQVLINLLLNAMQALEEQADARITLRARIGDTGRAVIEVHDNGPGILPEVRERIFVPFFTTKQSGSGIGLSLSRQILRLHGGTLTVRSTPGVETVFVLRF